MDPQTYVDQLLTKLRSERLTFFPIRHHSPACAAHLAHWIEQHQPASVLIEGPGSFTNLVDLLCDERCRFPVAVYVNFIDHSGHLMTHTKLLQQGSLNLDGPKVGETEPDRSSAESVPELPSRFSGYYPFCDYSPEAIAMRVGRIHGARIRFIDLEFAEKVLASVADASQSDDPENEEQSEGVRVESLTADAHLTHSTYTRRLAQRMGCRDFDELWDHLFESNWDAFDSNEFIDRVAAYCAMTRLTFDQSQLNSDGTTAREACMAAAIQAELAQNAREGRIGPVLVVTGGFHTVALPDLVSGPPIRRPAVPKWKAGETGSWLMRYSFNQLDSLSGYASGMPSPAFYDQMWGATDSLPFADPGRDRRRTEAAIELLIEVGRLSRERKFAPAITTPDVIAAAQMIRQLATLRGHRWPQREDLLDSVRSCFIKGETTSEGMGILQLVREILAGKRVGEIPPNAGTPPIVMDFREQTRRLKLSTDSIESRELALDLYRNSRHREISRLFHRLSLLEVPYARFVRGPDFVQGAGLELMNEHWQTAWSPNTDSNLIEASVYGPTIGEAAFHRLREQIALLEKQGEARNTAAAVAILLKACRLGLQEHTMRLVTLIDAHISEDPQLSSVVQGLTQLELLQHSLEPLEATHLEAIPRLMVAAYHRACRLIDETPTCPEDSVQSIMEALKSLREVVHSATVQESDSAKIGASRQSLFDIELFHQALKRVIGHPADRAQAAIVGAAAGVLYGDGILNPADLVAVAAGYLGGAMVDPRKSCGIVRGLLATAREVAWHVAEILTALDKQFGAWDENTFLQVLPDLRLAFSDLTPREIANVADRVAALHGEQQLGDLVHMDLSEEDVQFSLKLTQCVRASLIDDGLDRVL